MPCYSSRLFLSLPLKLTKSFQNTPEPIGEGWMLSPPSRCHLGGDAPVGSPLWVLLWSWEGWLGIINSRKREIGPECSQIQWMLCVQYSILYMPWSAPHEIFFFLIWSSWNPWEGWDLVVASPCSECFLPASSEQVLLSMLVLGWFHAVREEAETRRSEHRCMGFFCNSGLNSHIIHCQKFWYPPDKKIQTSKNI